MSDKDNLLMKKFGQVLWQMHSYTRRSFKGGDPTCNPHQGQGRVLAILKLQPEISQKDLAYLLGMRPQSLGELLAKLEKSGYITREPSEEDRRVMIVRLTDAGRAAAEGQTDAQPVTAGLFDCLSEEEQDTLSGYLDRILDSLDRKSGDEGPMFTFDEEGGFRVRPPFGGRSGERGRGFVKFDWASVPGGFTFGVRGNPGGPCAQDFHGHDHGRGPMPDPDGCGFPCPAPEDDAKDD